MNLNLKLNGNPAWGAPVSRLRTRSAHEITASRWSIGGETLDREYASYEQYKPWLGPLGAKRIRLQSGWARTEAVPGKYQWGWLDQVIDGALAQSVQPWVQFSYGNPGYPGGGDARLAGGVPTSPEALAAWDRWVRASVERYRDRVRDWEVWNEPDIRNAVTPVQYTGLYVRTAEIVREIQPGARLLALALAHNLEFAREFLVALRQAGKLGLVDAITYHGYPSNPDNMEGYHKFRALLVELGLDIPLEQGETGAPSRVTCGALRDHEWDQLRQAKWDLRRMLVHAALEIPFSLFSIADMYYRENDAFGGLNSKGILECRPDLTVVGPKPAYEGARHVFSLFDERVAPTDALVQDAAVECRSFIRRDNGKRFTAFWLGGGMPGSSLDSTPVRLRIPGEPYVNPVLADLLSGEVWPVPPSALALGGSGSFQAELPGWDSPRLLAEAEALDLEPLPTR